jgi:hypothetical protein
MAPQSREGQKFKTTNHQILQKSIFDNLKKKKYVILFLLEFKNEL